MRGTFNFITGFLLILNCFSPLASAQNITLVGKYKPTQTGFGDVWGESNMACMGVWLSSGYGSGSGFGIYDISTPSAPRLVKIYNYSATVQNRFEQGVISNKICYVGYLAEIFRTQPTTA